MKNIIKKIKHFFIPHKNNDFTPHFFREAFVSGILFVIILLLVFSATTKIYILNKKGMLAAVLPGVLVDLANNDRQSFGVGALTRSQILDQAASLKAKDMAEFGYFAHTSPSGVTPWYWFSKVGYTFSYAGENLAIDFYESENVETAWMNSPLHKANILNSNFTEIGIATEEGFYNGYKTVYVVQMFGKPSSSNYQKNNVKNKDDDKLSLLNDTGKKQQVNLPEVKGAVESILEPNNLETIEENEKFISVKNLPSEQAEETLDSDYAIDEHTNYSKWYEKFIFLMPSYADKIYKILLCVVMLALITMLIVEIRRQKPKNIMYGIFIIVIILCLIYINKSIFITNLLL